MDFKDLEILRKGNTDLRQQNENLRKELEKTCKQYLDLYNKIENTKDLIRDLIKAEKYRIDVDDFTYIHLEQLGNLKTILDKLENKNGNR